MEPRHDGGSRAEQMGPDQGVRGDGHRLDMQKEASENGSPEAVRQKAASFSLGPEGPRGSAEAEVASFEQAFLARDAGRSPCEYHR